MAPKLMGKKAGMTLLFDDKSGKLVVCTVIEVGANVVTQIKSEDKDGYNAIQMGYDEIVAGDPRTVVRRVGKPLFGHFKKANVSPRRHLKEAHVEKTEDYQVGQELKIGLYREIGFVDVCATSIGKGYQGAMKLHGFKGGPAAHGSKFHRSLGSTGMRSTPGRCFPGGKRASHMGFDRVTVQNLSVVKVSEDENLIVVRGAVPGPRNGIVTISPAKKKQSRKKSK